MLVLNTSEIRKADQQTISSGQISAQQLMEHAACACLPQIFSSLAHRKILLVFCGNGNNGGDGLVIARHVAQTGKKVLIISDPHEDNKSELFLKNKNKLSAFAGVSWISLSELHQQKNAKEEILIVDAIFGTGLRAAPSGIFEEWILWINSSGAEIISIDVPSGCPGEDAFSRHSHYPVVQATQTLTFQFPRLSFFVPAWRDSIGKMSVLPIGLLQPEKEKNRYFFVDRNFASALLRIREPFGHKGSFGHLFLAAGSAKYSGAAVMACMSALRSGLGLLSAYVPYPLKNTLNVSCPEAIVISSESELFISGTPKTEIYSAVAAGPGMGTSPESAQFVKFLTASFRGPMLLDADALNILAENRTWLAFLPPLTVITPHPGEFERLAGASSEGSERWELLRNFSVKWNLIVVLKGYNTMVATPDGSIFFNGSGNAGLAKGGSGDVLSGIIAGLLAQGYAPAHAALLGVFVHGLAGDIAAQQIGQHAMLPSDLVPCLGLAFLNLQEFSTPGNHSEEGI